MIVGSYIPNKKIFTVSLLFILLIVGLFSFLKTGGGGRTVYVGGEHKDEEEVFLYETNKLSGVRCENHARRPLAVMIAEDIEARPLSGISSADLVIEMPVVTGSITRMMALFVCSDANNKICKKGVATKCEKKRAQQKIQE